jgi:GDP-4-dehydro-6-deoxy-D-mannose reductase
VNYLVTGGTGFVGSHILDKLVELQATSKPNLNIYATRRYHLSRRDKVLHLPNSINWIDCDITDSVSVNKLVDAVRPDFCLHMASESFVSPSWNHPNRYMNVNYHGTVNILEAIKNFSPSCKILIPGSGEEYGEVNESLLPINTNTPLLPVNPYAVTKIAQDLIGYVYFRSYGLNVIRLRTFNHEGPRREHYFGISSFCYQIALMEIGLQDLVLRVGHLGDRRNFTHVRDIVNAYLLSLEKASPGELYLVGSQSVENIALFSEVADRLIEMSALKGKVEVRQVPEFTRPTQVPILLADTGKFENLTGWRPTLNLNEILKETLEYWRDRVRLTPWL